MATSRTAAGATNARYVAATVSGTSSSTDPGGYYGTSLSNILIGAESSNGGVFNGGATPAIGHAVIFNRGLTAAELQVYGDAVTALQTALARV